MKALLLIATLVTSFSASAGQLLVESKTETINVENPEIAFQCEPGDGGYKFTTLYINPFFIPEEFGSNHQSSSRTISKYLGHVGPNHESYSCEEAMKSINNEIKKQGGTLKAKANRIVSLYTSPQGNLCKLLMSENLTIDVLGMEFHAIEVFTVKNIPNKSYFECWNYTPTGI